MRGLLILRFLDDKAVSRMDEASAIAELLAAPDAKSETKPASIIAGTLAPPAPSLE